MQEKRRVAEPLDNNIVGRLPRLLEEIQFGSESAAVLIHEKYVRPLSVLATKRIGGRFKSKIAPEDVVQSVFATFFRRHGNGEFDCPDWNDLWALLATITTNKCLVKINKLRTAKRDVKRESIGTDLQTITNRVVGQSSAHEIAIFNETLDALLKKVPAFTGEVVRLRLQGMSNFEISDALSCSERTVYRSISAVKRILEEELMSVEPLGSDKPE